MKSFLIGDLTILVPIVQGGMGIGISLSGLASAVASAGGHLGFSYENLDNKKFKLEELVTDIVPFAKELSTVHKKTIPVIADGGITNGCQIRKIIELGASAVKLGSIFIANNECDASVKFKQIIVQSNKSDIRLIKSPVGLPGRAVENDFLLVAERGEKRPGVVNIIA